jgi:hypothetical protein
MATKDIFLKIEYDIMKILTKSPGIMMSQYTIYDKLLEEYDYDIKDPAEKEDFKLKFLIVLRKLSFTFDNISVINNNKILCAGYDVPNDGKDFLKEMELNENKDTDYDKIKEDLHNNKGMPSEIHVIQFIVDEKLEKFYDKKDYNGNTILHNLILYSDFDRVKKIINNQNILFFDTQNKNGDTPVDLITDIRISNLIIKELLNNSSSNEEDIVLLEDKVTKLSNYVDNSINFFKIFGVIVFGLLYICY